MNFRHLRFKLFIAFSLIFALLYSCTKIVTTDIGSGLLPPADDVTTKDTEIEISTMNMRFDSVAVGISDDHVLGYVNDPIFGKTTASINFQVAPPSTPFSRGIPKENVIVDSVVLCLKYDGVWGDTNQALQVRVFSMDPEVVFNNAIVYNNTKTFTKGEQLTEGNSPKYIDIRTLDDVDTTKGYFTEIATNQLRIRLNKSFGEKILKADSATYYTSDTAFNNLLRGLVVQPEATGQALISINLTDTTTRLSLYYHNSDASDTVPLTRRFTPNVLTSASSNSIIRDYTGTPVKQAIDNPDSTQEEIYMQTSPGTRSFINISKLADMPNVIVHRAEVLMYQVPDASDKYLTPPNLFLTAFNEDSMRAFTIPYDINFIGGGISNLTQFGVAPRKKDDGSYFYSFDISRYVQSIVTRDAKIFNLMLMAPYNQYIYIDSSLSYAVPISSPVLNTAGVGRVRLGGGNNSNSQYKMRLHIVYSELD